jgi:hypothetical protein
VRRETGSLNILRIYIGAERGRQFTGNMNFIIFWGFYIGAVRDSQLNILRFYVGAARDRQFNILRLCIGAARESV